MNPEVTPAVSFPAPCFALPRTSLLSLSGILALGLASSLGGLLVTLHDLRGRDPHQHQEFVTVVTQHRDRVLVEQVGDARGLDQAFVVGQYVDDRVRSAAADAA